MPVIFSRFAVSLGEWVFKISAYFPLWFAQSRKNEGEKLFRSEWSCHVADSCKWRNMCLLCDDSMLLLRRLKTLLCVYCILAGHIWYSFQFAFYIMWLSLALYSTTLKACHEKITHSSHYLFATICMPLVLKGVVKPWWSQVKRTWLNSSDKKHKCCLNLLTLILSKPRWL